MSIVAQSPSHRGEIVELFIRDAATLLYLQRGLTNSSVLIGPSITLSCVLYLQRGPYLVFFTCRGDLPIHLY